MKTKKFIVTVFYDFITIIIEDMKGNCLEVHTLSLETLYNSKDTDTSYKAIELVENFMQNNAPIYDDILFHLKQKDHSFHDFSKFKP